MKLLLLLLAIMFTTGQTQSQPILISLFATDLTSCDDLSACDTVVKIMCASSTTDFSQCGITREVKDDNFPVFPERFSFNYVESEGQRWRFDLIDKDVLIDDPIGSVSVSLQEFVGTTPVFGSRRFVLENGRGSLYVHRREQGEE